MSGPLERSVMRSLVMPSLKYSWSRSPLILVKGRTAIEGRLGSGSADVCTGGIDAVVLGGRRERCCTSRMVPTMIASPTSENAPGRTYFLATRGVVLLGAVAPASTRNTRTG